MNSIEPGKPRVSLCLLKFQDKRLGGWGKSQTQTLLATDGVRIESAAFAEHEGSVGDVVF